MSFHEKNAWFCLTAILAVFVPYFIYVLQYPMAYVGLFVVATIVLVGLLATFHVINALASPQIRESGDSPPLDERDQQIEKWAAKISGIVLGTLVLIWCLNVMIGIPIYAVRNVAAVQSSGVEASLIDFSIPAMTALFAVHLLFAGFVLANIVYYGSIIAGYRRSS